MIYPVEIAPSILAADFACLGDGIRAVERGGATLLHVDVMDGHFVPNISIGVPVVASLRKATRLHLDVHLMIENPELYIQAFAEAGADMISVHQEATAHLDRALAMIREHGCHAGAVINLESESEAESEGTQATGSYRTCFDDHQAGRRDHCWTKTASHPGRGAEEGGSLDTRDRFENSPPPTRFANACRVLAMLDAHSAGPHSRHYGTNGRSHESLLLAGCGCR